MRKAVLPLLGSSILAVAATAALAADLPSRAAPPAFVPPPPVFVWTGFYGGVNIGVSFDENRQNTYVFSNAGGANTIVNSGGTAGVLSLAKLNNSVFTGGGQIGYNYQFNPGSSFVAGVETDAQYLSRNSSGTSNYTFTPNTPFTYGVAFVPVPGLAPPTVYRGGGRTNFFGTVRGRLGYAADKVLIYGTGGFAYSEHAVGYAVGGGVEYAITNNITIRGEYLYVDLDRTFGGFAAIYDQPSNSLFLNSIGGKDNFSVGRIAVNYKFDVGPPAVVARY